MPSRRFVLGAGLAALMPAWPGWDAAAQAQRGRIYGHPARLRGTHIPFTDWRWVLPGTFDWNPPNPAAANPQPSEYTSIDVPTGVRIVVKQASVEGPLLAPQPPNEFLGVTITSMIKDGSDFRGWGTTQDATGAFKFCSYRSTDGRNWARDTIPFTDSNILNLTPTNWIAGAVMKSPDTSDPRPYKQFEIARVPATELPRIVAETGLDVDSRALRVETNVLNGMWVSESADGYNWLRRRNPSLLSFIDTQLCPAYDAERGLWSVYVRSWTHPVRDGRSSQLNDTSMDNVARRAVGYTESRTLDRFPQPRFVMAPGPALSPSTHLYAPGKTVYPENPDHPLMFPTLWDHTDVLRIGFGVSTAEEAWALVSENAVPLGEAGTWNGGSIHGHVNLLRLANGDLAVPFTGFKLPHKYPRTAWSYNPGLAVWPKGRIAGIRADDEGHFWVPPVWPSGASLRVNGTTDPDGEIKLEVMDLGRVVQMSFDACAPITGDAFNQVVARTTGPLTLTNQPYRIRVRLRKATIYDLSFA